MGVYTTLGEFIRDLIDNILNLDESELSTDIVLDVMSAYRNDQSTENWMIDFNDEVVVQSLPQEIIDNIFQKVLHYTFEVIALNPKVSKELAIKDEWQPTFSAWYHQEFLESFKGEKHGRDYPNES